MNGALLPAWTLTQREVVRFLRQRNRIGAALGQPILFWMLFGSGFEASFSSAAFGELGYTQYFFPGTLVMIVLFTSIFASFSIIEDRNEGFLQGVLASPAPRLSIVVGKVVGGALIALFHGAAFLILAPLAAGIPLSLGSALGTAGLLLVIGASLTALGFCLAWRMHSTAGFHAIMMLFLMPLWFLSGSFFPAAGAPAWLRWVITVNPLSYGVAAVRRVLYSGLPAESVGEMAALPGLGLSIAVTLGTAVALTLLAGLIASGREAGAPMTAGAAEGQ